jgi:Rap1a immunity proteins
MKKTIAGLILASSVAFAPSVAHAEFWSGNDLYSKALGNSSEQLIALGYITGTADALTKILWCPPLQVTLGQVKDVVMRSIQDNPQTRHFSADSLIGNALRQVWPCAEKGRGT